MTCRYPCFRRVPAQAATDCRATRRTQCNVQALNWGLLVIRMTVIAARAGNSSVLTVAINATSLMPFFFDLLVRPGFGRDLLPRNPSLLASKVISDEARGLSVDDRVVDI